jgi:hypothetical protein
MCIAAAVPIAMIAASALQAKSQYDTGKYNQQVAETNAEIDNRAAADAVQRGADDAAKVRGQARRIAASQRAGTAASGVSVDTGSALDLLTETAGLGELEALTTLNNAQRQAYGYQVQGMNQTAQGRLARFQGNTQAVGSIMTGAAKAYSSGFGGK